MGEKIAQVLYDCLLNEAISSVFCEAQSLHSIWRAWANRGFGIMSVFTGDSAAKENVARTEAFKAEIRADGWGYIPLEGVWQDVETGESGREFSFFITLPQSRKLDQLRQWMMSKGAKYKQQAVVIHDPRKGTEIVVPNTGKILASFDQFKPDQVADNYSALLRGRHKGRVFHFSKS